MGVGLIVVAACGFGSGPLLAKPIYGTGVDWLTLLAWRFLVAAVISWGWLLVWPAHRAGLLTLSPRRLIVTALLGVFFVGNSGTYFAALETVDASLSALIVYVYPALVAVITLRFGRRLEGRRAWAALVLASLGVALAVGGIDPAHAPPPIGLALIISSPVIYAVWIVLAARLSGERASRSAPLPPYDSEVASSTRGVSHAAPTAAVMLSATALAWWIAALALGRPVMPQQIPGDAWLPLLGVGIISTAVALQAFYAGVARVGAAQASLISTVEPAYTIALAAILLGEMLTPIQLVGGALVIIGVVMAQTGSRYPR